MTASSTSLASVAPSTDLLNQLASVSTDYQAALAALASSVSIEATAGEAALALLLQSLGLGQNLDVQG